MVTRRDFLAACSVAAMAVDRPARARGAHESRYRLRYIVASAMYGDMPLATVLSQVEKCGAAAIDLWPRPHGSQWDEAVKLGWKKVSLLLAKSGVRLGGIASYRFGPFGLKTPLAAVREIGVRDAVLVTTARGPKGLKGKQLKEAIAGFVQKMQPHLVETAAAGATVAIENHSASLLETADGIRWFAEQVRKDLRWGIAFAPHHLPQDAGMMAELIEDLGPAVKFFYAQQHGMGSRKKLPKEQEMLQMPGRGTLDFAPLVGALRKIDYRGYVEIFMHPVPRGVPILPTAGAITAEINRSRAYLAQCLEASS